MLTSFQTPRLRFHGGFTVRSGSIVREQPVSRAHALADCLATTNYAVSVGSNGFNLAVQQRQLQPLDLQPLPDPLLRTPMTAKVIPGLVAAMSWFDPSNNNNDYDGLYAIVTKDSIRTRNKQQLDDGLGHRAWPRQLRNRHIPAGNHGLHQCASGQLCNARNASPSV